MSGSHGPVRGFIAWKKAGLFTIDDLRLTSLIQHPAANDPQQNGFLQASPQYAGSLNQKNLRG
jgi:hypothetical protein